MEVARQISACSPSLSCAPTLDHPSGKLAQSVKHFGVRGEVYPEGNRERKAGPGRIKVSAKKGGDSPTGFPWKQNNKSSRDSLVKSDPTRENLESKAAAPAAIKTSAPTSAPHTVTKAGQQFLYHTEGGGQWMEKIVARVRIIDTGGLNPKEATSELHRTILMKMRTGDYTEPLEFVEFLHRKPVVRATVDMATDSTYSITIQADVSATPGSWALHWGLFRSNSKDWVLLDPDSAPSNTKYVTGRAEAMRTPLQAVSSRQQELKLEFDAEKAPFYMHFVLYRPAIANTREAWIRNSVGGNFCVPVGARKGCPEPLGLTWKRDGAVNFALYSKNAESVNLCLYDDDAVEPSLEIDLEPSVHRTGDVWHVELEDVGGFTRYGYRCKGEVSWESGNRFQARNVLLDPYAKLLAPLVPGQEKSPSVATVLGWLKTDIVPFDWEDDAFLHIPLERLFAYRMNVVGFTADESSYLEEDIRGTFDGLIRKGQHLVNLGVNAVILEPIFSHFDNSLNPFSFFTPASQYGPGDSLSACTSLKRMVKGLHKFGIEVILEVVFSHTAERGDELPKTVSFRGIDNATFYILNEFGRVVKSEGGAENAFNCNQPSVQTMIIDSLRHWVEEFHVDGFLFVNGSALVTGPHGQELSRPPLVEAISFDPILAGTKLIVNTSSPFTGVSKSFTFPHWRRWCEWNNGFRDTVRQFMRGDLNQLSTFATLLCGSGDLFAGGRGPNNSFNFVTSSYGLTLADLVRASFLPKIRVSVVYSEGDGVRSELSWNCGAEGPSSEDAVLETRVKQVRNFILALLLSEGVPVMNMGDEYGHSRGGNVTVDESSSNFLWSYVDTEFGQQICGFISSLVAFRLRHKELFERTKFADLGSITWHGVDAQEPLWDEKESPFVGAYLHAQKPRGGVGVQSSGVYIAFNARQDAVVATLPGAPTAMAWYRIADTSLPHPEEFVREGVPIIATGSTSTYEFQPNSSVVLEARQRFIVSLSNSTLKFPASKSPKRPLA